MKFKDIPAFPGYKVSKNGRVFSAYLRGEMKLSIHGGYYKVKLKNGKITKTKYVHCLVAQTYLPNPHKLPCVNHKDGTKLNNCVENL